MTTSESRDGTGAGDKDQAYEWGNPLTTMSAWQRIHLSQMVADIRAYKVGERGRAPDGDLSSSDKPVEA